MNETWKLALTICGIGAVGAMTLLALYKQWLKLDIFAKLTRKQTFVLMLIFLVFTFLFGVGTLVTYTMRNRAVDLSASADDLVNGPPTKELITLTAVFTSTGERVPVKLPLDIRGDSAARLIFERVFLNSANKDRFTSFDYDTVLLIKGDQTIVDKTIREADLQEGDEVHVRVLLREPFIQPAPYNSVRD